LISQAARRSALRINNDDEQLRFWQRLRHNWVINKAWGKLECMARVTDPNVRPRFWKCGPTEPGVQFYTANFPGWQHHWQRRLGLPAPQCILL